MASTYKQYTSCSQPENWVSPGTYLGMAGAALAVVWIPIIALAGWCSLFWLVVAAAAEAVAFATWWLEVRLVCLGGDRSAIGMVVSTEPPKDKKGFDALDSDFSMNLLPYPALPGVVQADLEITAPYGPLVAEQPSTKQHVGFFTGEKATDKQGVTSAILHAEFEGAGIYDFRIGATVALGLAIAALVACVALPPPWGIIAGAILTILAFLAALFGGLFGAGDNASPGDVSGAPTEIHDNDATTGLGADLLYVSGTWVFDSLHTGWNEIHPIKVCTKVGTWDGAWPADTEEIQKRLDDGFKTAADPATVSHQQDPRNRWSIHPLVDGCDVTIGIQRIPDPAGGGAIR